MTCPQCSASAVRCLETRGLRRRRCCGNCGGRWTTEEVIVEPTKSTTTGSVTPTGSVDTTGSVTPTGSVSTPTGSVAIASESPPTPTGSVPPPRVGGFGGDLFSGSGSESGSPDPDQISGSSQQRSAEGSARVERTAQVAEVFAHYQGYHPKAKLGDKGARLLRARLADGYSPEDLKRAIDGYHRSPYHCGVNKDGREYLSLDLIARDAEHVTQGIEFLDKAGAPVTTEKEKRTLLAASSWLERRKAMRAQQAAQNGHNAERRGL